mmetsp:Transcript_387/g.1677  ORF Transcript_387/g.1677 Transcript_387/m.1677 type:complete len:276 (+) Transcript_387:420-1247(+)
MWALPQRGPGGFAAGRCRRGWPLRSLPLAGAPAAPPLRPGRGRGLRRGGGGAQGRGVAAAAGGDGETAEPPGAARQGLRLGAQARRVGCGPRHRARLPGCGRRCCRGGQGAGGRSAGGALPERGSVPGCGWQASRRGHRGTRRAAAPRALRARGRGRGRGAGGDGGLGGVPERGRGHSRGPGLVARRPGAGPGRRATPERTILAALRSVRRGRPAALPEGTLVLGARCLVALPRLLRCSLLAWRPCLGSAGGARAGRRGREALLSLLGSDAPWGQ